MDNYRSSDHGCYEKTSRRGFMRGCGAVAALAAAGMARRPAS
ncbi:MAG: twin-arginine translocation signal domain-containing protein, partial [Euryarchaeota archaeon]|nr:twin-arginine translocation signal domain-containing protein [Euryarchaeota archaeon]